MSSLSDGSIKHTVAVALRLKVRDTRNNVLCELVLLVTETPIGEICQQVSIQQVHAPAEKIFIRVTGLICKAEKRARCFHGGLEVRGSYTFLN